MTAVLLCQGTALALPLRDASVHCVVTSPPYFGLRRYDCGPGELGLEASPDAYVAAMVQVFREVYRVLRPDGTLWLNMGDSYIGSANAGGETTRSCHGIPNARDRNFPTKRSIGLPAKNLMGMPWRVALALQADGWILRSDIIWDKPSCMPESVQDRPTRSHEYVFLCSKSPRYFYDQEATREPHSREWWYESVGPKYMQARDGRNDGGKREGNGTPSGRNARTVWRIASEPFSGSHFATFPPALVRRCLLAGAPSAVCQTCGAPWRRQICHGPPSKDTTRGQQNWTQVTGQRDSAGGLPLRPVITTGFAASCTCNAGTQPATILDPFVGSGTVPMVARELGHHAVGLDLSYRYLHDIARERLGLAALAAWTHGQTAQPVTYADLPLFGG